MELDIRPRSFVLASGTVLATLVPPGMRGRMIVQAILVGGANYAAMTMDPRGIQVFTTIPDDHEPGSPAAPQTVASATASWVVANLVAGRVFRHVPLPRVLKAVAAGGAVVAIDRYIGQAAVDTRDRMLAAVPND